MNEKQMYCNRLFIGQTKLELNNNINMNANLANFRYFLKSLGGFVALDKVDVSLKTSA